MRNLVSIIAFTFLLSGCAEYDGAAQAVTTYAAAAADRSFKAAKWDYCKATTAGSLFRKYENDWEGLVLWGKVCWRDKVKLHKALELFAKPVK